MLALLKSRVFLVTLGLILLAVIIWFAGPYFAFAEYKPLESVVARLVAILVLAVGYAAYVQLKSLGRARAGQKLAEEVAKQDDKGGGSVGQSGSAGDAAQLRKRFEEAVEALKKSKKKGSASLYELPWYIIIGPPGAGKTTVLVNSGLNFPLAQKFGKEALRGVGGTRNCDWWFTDEAIILDTAGRFTTQDSNARADAAGWEAFLQLLRKFRGRQPINGVIIAVSASDLLALGEREREQQVTAIRARLDELGQNLRIDMPVYFLVTKADLIAGFAEFFDDLGQEARNQVWGVTFPIEATESGRAAETFGGEFDRLVERLQGRVLARMEGERDPRRRVGVLGFPQQIATLKPMLDDLLKRVFLASGFDRQLMLRGVYFTSGTQEGTPIDRMLAAIGRTFGVTSAVAPPAAGKGKAYFIERLLRGVIFNESGLAGVNRRVQLQKIAAQSFAYIACVVVLVLGCLWLLVSYNANASYIDEVAAAARNVATLDPATVAVLPVDARLGELDSLRDVTTAAEKYKAHVPWTMRLGLYRGAALGEAARAAYTRDLNSVLVPVLRGRFEQALQTDVAAPDRLYEYLKGYLMLGDSHHRDSDHLRFLSQNEWRNMYASDPATVQRLDEHFGQLLTGDALRSVTPNAQSVEQARAALRSASIPVLMYDRLKLNYLDDQKRAVRLDIAAGSGAALALVRRSGKPLSQPVPALYTRAVFNEINTTGKYQLVEQFAADSWVFGDNAFDLRQGGAIIYQVLGVYEADYIRAWDEVVKDVAIKPAADAAQFTDILGIISSPASPLKGFLSAVAANTDLLKPDTSVAGQVGDAVGKALDAKLGALQKIMGSPPEGAAPPGTKVTVYFAPIRQLVEGPPGQAPIDLMLATLDQQHRRLQSTGSGVGQQSALDPAVQAAVGDAKRSLNLMATQLPAPLGNIVSEVATRTETIVSGQARGELARRYAEQVVNECHDRVEGRYPLNPASHDDVALEDFGRVFGAGGVFDTFFRDNLAPLVDTSHPQWRWRDGAAAGPASMLQQFQRVQHIRDVYFAPGGKVPEAHFTLAADTLDASVKRFTLTLDGQPFEYHFGPVQNVAVNWPGSIGEAVFAFEDRSGPIPGASLHGPWALFRLLEQVQTQRDSDRRYRITFSAGGKSMHVILEAASIRNPFGDNALAGFRCSM
jgi:type VI secretion system protein ImpL